MSDEQIKKIILDRLRARAGEKYVRANARFIEQQWEYLVSIGMLDPETDSGEPTESD